MKELMNYLKEAISGNNPVTAMSIPTEDVKRMFDAANVDMWAMLTWLAGYYQLLRWLSTKGTLTKEARKDFNMVETFLKQFDDKDAPKRDPQKRKAEDK